MLHGDEVRELEERLKQDAEARALFAEYCLMHAEIRFQVSAQNAMDAAEKALKEMSEDGTDGTGEAVFGVSGRRQRTSFAKRLSPHIPMIVAASLLVAGVLGMAFQAGWFERGKVQPQVSHPRPDLQAPHELVERSELSAPKIVKVEGFVAQLTAAFRAKWEDAAAAPFVRQYLPIRQVLDLRDGIAEVTFTNGMKVVLEGPCRFTITSPDGGMLERGRMVAGNRDRRAGFQIKTPQALVIDLGADFGVDVDSSGDMQVHVFDGVTQLALSSGKPTANNVRVVSNESVSIVAGVVTAKAAADPQRFARIVPQADDRLAELMRESLITHYAFDDPKNLAHNAGRGRDGMVEPGVAATSGVPALGQGGDFGTDDLRAINVAEKDVKAFSPGGKDGSGLTVAAWVRTTCIDQRGNVFFAYNSHLENSNTHRDIVLLELEYGGLPNALVRDEEYEREVNLVHPKGIADGKWHHIALTLSPGTEKTLNLYVDGELTGTSSSRVINDVTLQRARVGRRLCEKVEDDNDFQGVIDELLILNRALKPSELRWLFNSTRPKWI
jgi:hypothetical protein